MAKKKHVKKEIYEYECTITGEKFKTTRKAPNPEELISIKAYYDLNPDEDDRPETVKAELGFLSEDKPAITPGN